MRLVLVVTIVAIFVLALASPALAGTYDLPAVQQSGVSGSVDIGASQDDAELEIRDVLRIQWHAEGPAPCLFPVYK